MMQSRIHLAALAATLALAGCQDAIVQPVYSVHDYDPSRDAAADLAETIRLAGNENKRILLQVGGQWCGWCHKLDRYVAEHPAVAAALAEHYIIMKVNYSEDNRNEEFLAQFPKIPGYPHLYVLRSDGALLFSQPTAELEAGDSYDEAAVLAFLERWKG